MVITWRGFAEPTPGIRHSCGFLAEFTDVILFIGKSCLCKSSAPRDSGIADPLGWDLVHGDVLDLANCDFLKTSGNNVLPKPIEGRP